MPRKKQRAASRRELGLDEFMELSIGSGGDSVFESPFVKRAAWNLHRRECMEFMRAGSRPDAWWLFEAPEPRRVIGKEEIIEPNTRIPGTVHCSCGEIHKGYACQYEPEEEYLRRLGLLEEWEEAELAAVEQLRSNTDV